MTVLTLFLFSVIVWINRGLYDPSVLALTALFFVWVLSVILNWKKGRLCELGVRFIPILWACLFLIKSDVLYIPIEEVAVRFLIRILPLSGILIYQFVKGRTKWIGLGLLALPFILTLWYSPSPHIDVFQSNWLAVDYFLKGLNPYSQSYPDIYGNSFDYKPGFLYWPGALLFQTISQFIFHDIRTILVLAWLSSIFFFQEWKKWIRLWWTVPFLAFAFEQAWLDPLIVFGGALTLYALRKKNHFLWVIGVVIAASVKQYGFMIGLFSVFYFFLEVGLQKTLRPVLGMVLGLTIILLPFILWSPSDFIHQTILNHTNAGVRPDALNFTAFWLKQTGLALSGFVQLIAIVTGFVLALIHVAKNRVRRNLKVIPEAWAIFFGFSILFGKFAFCNYYTLMLSFWMFAEIADENKSLSAPETLPRNSEGRLSHTPRSV